VMMALVAAGVLGVMGFAIQRGAFVTSMTQEELQRLRNTLLDEIARLDDLHALGQIDDKEWLRRRSYLKTQLMETVRHLDGYAARRR